MMHERYLTEIKVNKVEVGGLQELVNSAGGFAVLDIGLLQEILKCYNIANLWAATGWFLERFRQNFHVPEEVLDRMAQHRRRVPR